jgi:hypothetical protein
LLILGLAVALEKLAAIGSTVAALISLSSAATAGFTEEAELAVTAEISLMLDLVATLEKLAAIGRIVAALASLSLAATVGFTEEAELAATA